MYARLSAVEAFVRISDIKGDEIVVFASKMCHARHRTRPEMVGERYRDLWVLTMVDGSEIELSCETMEDLLRTLAGGQR